MMTVGVMGFGVKMKSVPGTLLCRGEGHVELTHELTLGGGQHFLLSWVNSGVNWCPANS